MLISIVIVGLLVLFRNIGSFETIGAGWFIAKTFAELAFFFYL